MKTNDTNPAGPVKSEHAEQYEQQVGSLDLSPEQVDKRALVQTALLREIVAQEEVSSWHHGGLNE